MKLNEKVSYSAVAAAVAVACAGGASFSPSIADAATLGGSTLVLSRQSNALANSTTAFTTVTLAVTLGAGYVSGDRIRLTASGSTFPTTGKAADITCGGGTINATTYDTSVANFRSSSTIADGTACSFVVALNTRAITSSASISYLAQFAGTSDTLDTAAARTVVNTVDQFSSSITTLFNNTVDVNSGRYLLLGDDGSVITNGNEDHLVVSLGNNTSTLSAASTGAGVTSVVTSITGDFSFLDDDGTAGCSASDIAAGRGVAVASSGSLGISADCRTLTLTNSGNATGDFTSGLFTVALGKNTTVGASSYSPGTSTAGAVLEKILTAPQTYTASVAFTYYNTTVGATTTASATTTSGTSGNAGTWSLNGASINVAFMPFNSESSRILNLTNRSTQSGAVTVSAINESGVSCPDFSVGTISAGSILNISSAVDAGVRACYGSSFTGRAALRVTANVPGTDAELYSGYNRNGSLSTVVNSSNGK